MNREEAYHRMHAQMWAERLRGSAEARLFWVSESFSSVIPHPLNNTIVITSGNSKNSPSRWR